jgi:PAS domain S-box-containing protein
VHRSCTAHRSRRFRPNWTDDPADFVECSQSPTGQQLGLALSGEDRLKWKGMFERAIVEKVDYEQEFRILLPNGMVKWIHTVGRPVLSNTGDLEGFVGSLTDIMERKSAEQEHEKL